MQTATRLRKFDVKTMSIHVNFVMQTATRLRKFDVKTMSIHVNFVMLKPGCEKRWGGLWPLAFWHPNHKQPPVWVRVGTRVCLKAVYTSRCKKLNLFISTYCDSRSAPGRASRERRPSRTCSGSAPSEPPSSSEIAAAHSAPPLRASVT